MRHVYKLGKRQMRKERKGGEDSFKTEFILIRSLYPKPFRCVKWIFQIHRFN